ncbi:hypothetical protein CARUB_v10013490mg [Capsella rubella]|uniref:Uncharacterized protein n=2 Tax=Capsella rubella TaxID=81985 RepID=R0G4F4_9BRAS|nr:hypothetical protein CARUB_v10013490mg [Capsella rubella]
MKKKAIMIDDVDDSDSIMHDYYDGGGCTRFMKNAISKHTCAMSEKIDVPIICLDEEDDDSDDERMIDKDYSVFLDHLRRGDNSLFPPLEVDNGRSDTRRYKFFSSDSKLENENPTKNRAYQQGKSKSVGFKAERVNVRENIQRDNRVAERRKRRIAEFEAAKTSRDVPSLETQQQRQNKARKIPELKADALRAVPSVTTQEARQRDNTVSQGSKRKAGELNSETLKRPVPLVRTEEDIQLDNIIAVNRMAKFAAETSRVAHVERANRVSELKDVDETSRSKGDFVGRRKKNEEEGAAAVDKDYMRYLTWLLDSLRDSTTKPTANPSDLDPPNLDTLNEPTMVPETDPLVKVKIEQDLESWSDGSDIIAIDDTPFLDEEGTPFVASKKVVDLDEVSKADNSSSCWYRKQLMDVLKKPYDEKELKQLHRYATIHKKMTRCRELRKGRERDYETDELGQSYLESFPDFEKEYKLVDGVDQERALKLLRGFFFYLKYVSHDGAFKPWEENQ